MNSKYELSPGYQISRIENGCWQLSDGHSLDHAVDFTDVMKAFYELYDLGFTTFDCADIYTGAEEFIGSFIARKKAEGSFDPDSVQIHTKYVPDINMLSEVNFDFTESIIDRSLMRLNKDHLDLVQFHWWDYDVPGCIETALDLVKLQQKGKIRNIGVTNFDTDHLAELVDAGVPVVSIQTQYSLLDRRVEKKMQAYCSEKNIAMICYGTLLGGFLAERYIGRKYEDIISETRSQVKYLQIIEDSLGWEGYQKLLILLKSIADAHSVGIPQVATQFILKQEAVGAAIVGLRNSRHVQDNARVFSFDLSDEEVSLIRTFIDSYTMPEGEPFELERTVGSKYRSIMHMNVNAEEQS